MVCTCIINKEYTGDVANIVMSLAFFLLVLNVAGLLKLHAGGSGVRRYDGLDLKLFILVGWDRSFLSVAWPT